jgi:hypothetical protein
MVEYLAALEKQVQALERALADAQAHRCTCIISRWVGRLRGRLRGRLFACIGLLCLVYANARVVASRAISRA